MNGLATTSPYSLFRTASHHNCFCSFCCTSVCAYPERNIMSIKVKPLRSRWSYWFRAAEWLCVKAYFVHLLNVPIICILQLTLFTGLIVIVDGRPLSSKLLHGRVLKRSVVTGWFLCDQFIQFSLANIRHIRNNLTTKASKSYLNGAILSYEVLSYQLDTDR